MKKFQTRVYSGIVSPDAAGGVDFVGEVREKRRRVYVYK